MNTRIHKLLTIEGDGIENQQLSMAWYIVDQICDFVVGFIRHPAVDHLHILLIVIQQLDGLRVVELHGLISEGPTQIHIWGRDHDPA